MAAAPAKPFLKWAGGKTHLLDSLRTVYPAGLGDTVCKYAEPFVGGGAVLFDLLAAYRMKQVYIGDSSPQLINAYLAVRDHVEELVERLSPMEEIFHLLDSQARRAYYNAQRTRFNRRMAAGHPLGVEDAALLIFLNRTCFNGLYRVNRRGLFNVPMGAYRNPMICDGDNLRACSALLQGVEIVCGDYQACAPFVDEHTFVYFDPPYRPLSPTSSFTAYTSQSFNDGDQEALARFARELAGRGALVALSNSDPRSVCPEDDFLERIYDGFTIKRVQAARMINSKAAARGAVSELLITSYPAPGGAGQ